MKEMLATGPYSLNANVTNIGAVNDLKVVITGPGTVVTTWDDFQRNVATVEFIPGKNI